MPIPKHAPHPNPMLTFASGEFVLFPDHSVRFLDEDKNKVGYNRNTIYVMDMDASGTVIGPRGWVNAESKYDSIIVWDCTD